MTKKLLILLLLLLFTTSCYAAQIVRGYYKSNGTYVKPYIRNGLNKQYSIPKAKTNYKSNPSYINKSFKF